MSDKVDKFLSECGGNNFTATAPRPPVPGEENEKESNGGMSTRSSGSHKSQQSHHSHSSGRSIGSNKGDVNPATPRKSNLSCSVPQGSKNEMDAPLGFEPEGSAANSPPFTENSTPPYIKWAESLHVLLEDRDGVQLFRTFLDQEEIGAFSLDFWFACQGVKKGLKDKTNAQTNQIIKVIHKKYIKSDKLPFLGADTKRAISENLQSDIDLSIFNAAQKEVEEYMSNEPYQLFLKSDLYVEYVSRGGESPKSSNCSSGSNSARPLSSQLLPTLKEDQELQQDDFAVPFSVSGPPKSMSRTSSDSKRQEFVSPYSYHHSRPPAYHVTYAPVSAQDSEIQSLSSQDDALSLTDSSVDGHSHSNSRKHKRYRAMQRKAVPNRDMAPFIPRTERAPKDRNIAEVDPKAFAEKLIAELEKVVKDREKEERVQLSLSKVMNQSDLNESMDKTYLSASSRTNTTSTSIVPLLTSSLIEEENADSILEEHCSRIWERSAHHTPSRSPGRHSPRSKSPDRFRKPFAQTQPHAGSASMPGTLHNKSYNKKRSEFYSMASFDSGVGEDLNNKCSVETHKHIHHHHHHHHDRRKSKHKLEIQAQHHSMVCWADGSARLHPQGGARQKTSSSGRHSDANSNLDSGISMIESVGQTHPEVIATDPSTSKSKNVKSGCPSDGVLQWILDNENINLGANGGGDTGTTRTDSEKTISSKRSHKASALAPAATGGPPQQYTKHSSSKKVAGSHINRSASADSSNRVPWVPSQVPCGVPGVAGVMPSQPIATDPSMPIMPPPNTTVQLEEVNRRLEADHACKATPVKSKSFTGVPNKDKRPPVPASQSCFQVRTPAPGPTGRIPLGVDLDSSVESRAEKRSSKKSSGGSGNTSTSSKPEETVIGYYFCGEPIPYRITVPQPSVNLGQLKNLIGKRGFFRYFVKTYSRDFDTEAVYEEIKEDAKVLPVFEGKVVVKIDRIDEMGAKK